MDAHIAYAHSADGTTIATWKYGEGSPLVVATLSGGLWPPSAIWDLPAQRRFFDQVAARHTLVMYDGRGMGLSQRDVDDFSLEANTNDLRAVAELHDLEQFAVYAWRGPARTAVSFAASSPDRVSKLILRDPALRRRDYRASPRERALSTLIESDFEFYAEATALSQGGWEMGASLSRTTRGATTKDVFLAASNAGRQADVWPNLPEVACPTLVVHSKGAAGSYPMDVARRVTAAIPLAHLAVIEGGMPFDSNDADSMAPVLLEFLADAPRETRGTAASRTEVARQQPSALRTVLFTDLVGHTEMMQRLGDANGRDVLREHERITRETLKQHGGAEVKTMGDGFMASFGSVTSALDCAIALQRAFATHTESMPEPLHVRVGLNAGEPIEEDGDLFGSTVILASRIAARAGGGETLIPEPVRHLLSGKSFVFSDRGEFAMKGFDDAVRLYEVGWRE